MRLSLLLTLLATLTVSANTSVMSQRVNLSFRNAELREVFRSLKEQTGYMINFSEDELSGERVTVDARGIELRDALEQVLSGLPYTYQVKDRTVVIIPERSALIQPRGVQAQVRGTVRDAGGNPMAGVTVREKGSTRGISTDHNGQFAVSLLRGGANPALIVSYIGYETREVAVTPGSTVDVVLKEKVAAAGEVLVTGVFNKMLESHPGSVTSFTREQIRENWSRDALHTIALMEPSLRIVANNKAGSDPNALPELELRGSSSFLDVSALQQERSSQANTPLFIYDGFEITLQQFIDLNPEEIAGVTILKDASATSLYGSRGANGVIVITPTPYVAGKLRVSYAGSLNMEIPDLSTFNTLDAGQKLAAEAAVGLYRDYPDMYKNLLDVIGSGVNTDWAKMATRSGYGQSHSLSVGGGENSLRFNLAMSYNDIQGVMKGSSHNNTNANLGVSFEKNRFYISTSFNGVLSNSHESPYGLFSEVASLNPYWTMKNDEGEYNKTFQHVFNMSSYVPNAVFNGTTTTFDKSANTTLMNNTKIRYSMLDNALRLEAQLSVGRNINSSDRFTASANTRFIDEADPKRRGEYRKENDVADNWETSFTATYGKVFGDKHSFNAYLRTGLLGKNRDYSVAVATGYINDALNHFSNALVFQQPSGEFMNGPTGAEVIEKQTNFTGSVNYYYDQRYFADLNISYNGGSSFGSNSRWQKYYAVGAGWNVHNEKFFNVPWMNRLTAKYTLGVSGSSPYSPYEAMYIYEYLNDLSSLYRGQVGSYMVQFGNPNLGWQNVYDQNAELNVEFLDGRVQLTGAWYHKLTKNASQPLGLSPTHGYKEYTANVGELTNEGWEARFSYNILRTRDWRVTLSSNLAHNKNKVKKLSDEMKSYLEENSITTGYGSDLYYSMIEGSSMRALYAIESPGVDPMTGKRIYLNEEGVPQIWSSSLGKFPRVYVGDGEPKANGSTTVSVWWKGLMLTATLAYHWGGYALNSTVLNKVEQISWTGNIDRRVYTDRWRKPGDVSKYKDIADTDSYTNANTSFVQRDNMITLAALNLSYEFPLEWVRRNLGLESLMLSAQMSDIYYSSTIWRERGTAYPYSYNPNFTIRCTF